MPEIFLTKESYLRQLTNDDLGASLALLNIPGLAAEAGMHLPNDDIMQKWAVSNWINQQYLWGIFKSQELVGLIAIFPQADGPRELGFLLEKACREHGLMTKAVQALLSRLNFEDLAAETSVGNAASIAILKKAGFQRNSGQEGGLINWTYRKSR